MSNGSDYSFEEAWLFLERYGGVYLEVGEMGSIELRSGFTKENGMVKKIIRVISDDWENRFDAGSWGREHDVVDTLLLREKLSRYLDTVYIG